MKLIPGICTQCGATLSVESKKEIGICPYCNTPFIIEKAIKNFNNTYFITNNITAQNVIVQEDTSGHFDIVGGVLLKYTGPEIDVVIPSIVREIGEKAFYGSRVEKVKMSNNVTDINYSAFAKCKYLKRIVLSKNLVMIGGGAFESCERLVDIVLPYKLITIGNGAFESCRSLVSVKLPDKLEILGDGAFKDCSNLETVYLSSHLFETCENLSAFHCGIYSDGKSYSGCIKLLNIYVDGEKLKKNSNLLLKYFSDTVLGFECRKMRWRKRNRCQYCGKEFSGFFTLRCSNCGIEKDY